MNHQAFPRIDAEAIFSPVVQSEDRKPSCSTPNGLAGRTLGVGGV